MILTKGEPVFVRAIYIEAAPNRAFHHVTIPAPLNQNLSVATEDLWIPPADKDAGTECSANALQVGGTHYQKAIQPWDFIVANGLGFLEGNAIKYLTRFREKGGVEDLKKARHYIDKLIEVESAK